MKYTIVLVAWFACLAAAVSFAPPASADIKLPGNKPPDIKLPGNKPVESKLSVTLTGEGGGRVQSVPIGINCPGDCSESYPVAGTLTLNATANAGSIFAGWSGSGECTGTTACVLNVNKPINIVAKFNKAPRFTLTVNAGGAGVVTSVPPGIVCSGTSCVGTFNPGPVQLIATPSAGAVFTGYSGGGCGTAPTCAINLSAATAVTATFVQPTLAVTLKGDGVGRITSVPAGISCGSASTRGCSAQFLPGANVTLTQTATGSSFDGWGGDCSGAAKTCNVTVNAPRTVNASFNRVPLTLQSVTEGGNGGSVLATKETPSCAGTCVERVSAGASVRVEATPATGTSLVGWTVTGADTRGAVPCTNAALTCHFTMPRTPVTVRARFSQPTLVLNKTGTGRGTISFTPAQECGPNCSGNLSRAWPANTRVTISAAVAPGDQGTSELLSLSVLPSTVYLDSTPTTCSATPCMFDLRVPTTVTATFARKRQLTINVTGAIGVRIRVNGRSDQVCAVGSPTCTVSLAEGTPFTLLAEGRTAGTGHTWGGADVGSCGAGAQCSLRMLLRDMVVSLGVTP